MYRQMINPTEREPFYLYGTTIAICYDDDKKRHWGAHTTNEQKDSIRVISTFNITPVYIVSQLGYIILQWCIIKFYTYFVLSKVNYYFGFSSLLQSTPTRFPASRSNAVTNLRAPIYACVFRHRARHKTTDDVTSSTGIRDTNDADYTCFDQHSENARA